MENGEGKGVGVESCSSDHISVASETTFLLRRDGEGVPFDRAKGEISEAEGSADSSSEVWEEG